MKRHVATLVVAGLVAGALVMWVVVDGRRSSLVRRFQFRYTATITQIPSEAHALRLWVPLAATRDNQRIRARSIRSQIPYELHHEPVFGNELAYWRIATALPSSFEIEVDYDVEVRGGGRISPGNALASAAFASEQERALALRDEPLMVVNDSVRRLADEATAGQTTDLGRIRAIYDHVIRSVAYDKTTPGWGKGDTMRACLIGKGNCTDFHSLFISMSRSVGIPARFVIGAPIPEGPGGAIGGYHCWAEFYQPEYGWVPVDASEAWKHPERKEYYFGSADPNRIMISVGRNLELVPKQAGPPVNILVYPYLEIDGQSGGNNVETRFEYNSSQNRPWFGVRG